MATLFLTAAVSLFPHGLFNQSKARWLETAANLTPPLTSVDVRPVAVVVPVNDKSAYQHWRYDSIGLPEDLLFSRSFKDIKSITLDFGRHLTGYFSFRTKILFRCQDAPVRFRFFFGETPAELNTPLDPWCGSLSRAWMQDEVVTVTDIGNVIDLKRRFAFRYLKIELLGASDDFDFAIDDLYFRSVSSAGDNKCSLSSDCPAVVRAISDVGVATLGECMQTVFEDGPKRDRRLWAGDMYLQTLANRYSFRNFELTRRCLYLFAGLTDDDGRVMSNIFEYPAPHPQYGSVCMNYSWLWNSTLLEYFKDTADSSTAHDLWPVAQRQIEMLIDCVGDDGLFDKNRAGAGVWYFFDWRDGFDMDASLQAAAIFAIDQTYELASLLGKSDALSHWVELSQKMKHAARQAFFDKTKGVFLSGADRQLSLLTQAWMIKAGVAGGQEARKAISVALDCSETVRPGTPYATHYLLDAMLIAGMDAEARGYLIDYWGGMVAKGADTFWESYDPNDDFISAYGFSPLNSACHAWSCTPVYFINKYPEIFQKSQSAYGCR